MDRFILVQVIHAPRSTGTATCLSYFDMFAPVGERLRVALEPIAEEL